MNKNELIEQVASVTCAKTEARDAVELMISAIKEAVLAGERVTISEFGTFYLQFRRAKKGRNPKTGVEVDIPPRKVVKFTPSPKFNDMIIKDA